MEPFEYTGHPAHIVFGAGSSDPSRVGEWLLRLELERVLVVAAAADAALADPVADGLGARLAWRFDDVRAHVPIANARAARAAAADADADAVLSIGGGSTTGTAKAVALELGIPVVAIPTTYAGSEVTPVWGLTEDGRKTTGTDARVLPRLVIYDPALTVSLPVALTVTSALNAMAHCVEAFWAPGANPITSLLAEEGIRALAAGLPDALERPSDLEARSEVLYGAWLAGTAFASAGSDVHHKVCHVLGGAFDLPHADTHTIVLPYATAAVLADRDLPGVQERIAAALGAPEKPAADAILELERRLGAPLALADVGLAADELPRAQELVAETLSKIPEPLGRTQSDALLAAALHGTGTTTLTEVR